MENQQGKLHPLTLVAQDFARIMTGMGFEASEGHEIESEENNFDALNVPGDHPARDMHDTFWIKDMPGYVMRTHNTSHQVPWLRENRHRLTEGPIKMFSIGRVFRYEATDATHEVNFVQCDGVMVGLNVHMGHLKGCLENMLGQFMREKNPEMRLRPGYFPFVEPGVEVDMKMGGKWQEILGAGMIHPNVLEHAGIDSSKYSGFAFGMGIDRVLMIRNKLNDIRLSYNGDLRLHYNFN